MTQNNDKKTAVALGCFDGLHTGHIRVLQLAAAQRDNGLLPVALLFDEHPVGVLTGTAPERLLPDSLRNSLLCDMGMEIRTLSFRALQKLPPDAFVRDILLQELHAGFVACGFNFRFGCDGAGTAQTLASLADANGIACAIAPETDFDDTPVSSTRIRRALSDGAPEQATLMLGRPFAYDFEVVDGDKRGRLLGTPTINQYFPDGFLVPKYGVYASFAEVNGQYHPAVTNIGLRPTFHGTSPRSETWIMDYAGDLYGQHIPVRLLAYLRPEIRFPDADALRAQIHLDALASRECYTDYLQKEPSFSKKKS